MNRIIIILSFFCLIAFAGDWADQSGSFIIGPGHPIQFFGSNNLPKSATLTADFTLSPDAPASMEGTYIFTFQSLTYGGSSTSTQITNVRRGETRTYVRLFSPGENVDFRFNCYNAAGSNALFSYSFSFVYCPNMVNCQDATCVLCENSYCSIHDTHLSAAFECISRSMHTHCSNSQLLINSWLTGSKARRCDLCNARYCPLCVHVCGEGGSACPSLPSCVPTTCTVCGGSYCSKHNFHFCGSYTDYASNPVEGVASAIVTTQGSAVVNVDVNVEQDLDLSSVEAGLQSVDSSVQDVVEGVQESIQELSDQTGELSQQTFELTAQTQSLTGVEQTLEEIKESLGSQSTIESVQYSQTFETPEIQPEEPIEHDFGLLEQLKSKLVPPPSFTGGSSDLTLTFPLSFGRYDWTTTVDLNHPAIQPVRSACLVLSQIALGFVFCVSIVTVIRQW